MKTNGGHCGQKETEAFSYQTQCIFKQGNIHKRVLFSNRYRTEGFRFKQTEGDVKWKKVVQHGRSGAGRSNVRTAARSGTASF